MDPERWQQIQDLFDRALLLAEPERETLLRRSTAGDEDLLREVETLLTAEAESTGFIDDALSEGLDLFFEDEAETGEPSRFGKYEILEKIGEGGFGKVYRGRDPQLERAVAIKTCTARDPALRQRFFREARIAAALQHPKIVTIHDFGEEENLPYLVQELLDGEDLDQLIERQEKIPLDVQQSYLLQIAQGLAYAHGEKVLHRDIKPENVRVLPGGQIKILDFGIACLVNEQQRLTREHTTVGTVGYIAPEQLRGHDLDERSDIFSFGVLAYELLAMERPFQGRAFADIAHQILHREPRPLRRLRPQVPRVLAELVHRCLAKHPEERYPSFRQVADRLAEITTSSSRPAGNRFSLRTAAPLAALAVVVLATWIYGSKGGDGTLPELQNSALETAEGRPEAVPLETGGAPEAGLPASGPGDSVPAKQPAASDAAARNRPSQKTPDPSKDPNGAESMPPPLERQGRSPSDADPTTAAASDPDSEASSPATVGPADVAERAAESFADTTTPPPGEPPQESPLSWLGDSLAEPIQESPPATVATPPAEGPLTQPVLLQRPDPRYPALAQRRGREAQVIVGVLVDLSGSVQETTVIHCSDPGLGFEEAAREAARQASFRPAERDGKAVQTWTRLTFEFRLR